MKFKFPVLFLTFILSILPFISAAPVSHVSIQAMQARSADVPLELEIRGNSQSTGTVHPYEKFLIPSSKWGGLSKPDQEALKKEMASTIKEDWIKDKNNAIIQGPHTVFNPSGSARLIAFNDKNDQGAKVFSFVKLETGEWRYTGKQRTPPGNRDWLTMGDSAPHVPSSTA